MPSFHIRDEPALPELLRLLQAHEQQEEVKLEAVQDNNVELVTEILGDISNLMVKDDSAAELSRILQEPHFQVRRLPLSRINLSAINLCCIKYDEWFAFHRMLN